MYREYNESSLSFITFRVLYDMFLAFPLGPGGFRELREDYRNHFHRSWYLSDAVVTTYSQKPSWEEFLLASTIYNRYRNK